MGKWYEHTGRYSHWLLRERERERERERIRETQREKFLRETVNIFDIIFNEI